MYWYWFFAGPAVLLAILSLRGERRRAAYVRRRLSEAPPAQLPVTLIVPVKGEDEGLERNLAALAAQDYPDYELMVVARAAADIPPGVLPSSVRVLLAHGADPETGEKVQNLAAAVRMARPSSEIFAFADSDGRPGRGWLRALAAPLSEPGVGATTGFRWFTPEPADFWSLTRGVWDAVAFGRLGPGDNAFAWGGAMAIRKQTYLGAGVEDAWKRQVSDDYSLAGAVHRAGLEIAWAPGATTPCLDHTGARDFFSWMRRQMLLTRFYAPGLWRPALTAHVVYCAGMAAALAAACAGNRTALVALAGQLLPGMVKGLNRARTAAACLPESRGWFRRYGWTHGALVPLGTWLWLAALIASAFGDKIEWRGNRYSLRGSGMKGSPREDE